MKIKTKTEEEKALDKKIKLIFWALVTGFILAITLIKLVM